MTVRESQIAGVVLGGGKSRRMGADKSLLRLDRQTLLERAVDVLREVFDEVLIVADRADRFGGLGEVRVVQDILPDAGPLGGIHAGLTAVDSPAAFVVACDMPLLDAGVIRGQVDVWQTADADAVVPLLDGRPEPLHAVYAKSCLPAIEERIGQGDYRVRALLDAVRVHFWQPDPSAAHSFTNVNTPEDWARISETGGRRAR